MNIDAVAKAIYQSRPRSIEWDNLTEIGWKAEYRRMAEAAIKEMQKLRVRPEDIDIANVDSVSLATRINHARLMGGEW